MSVTLDRRGNARYIVSGAARRERPAPGWFIHHVPGDVTGLRLAEHEVCPACGCLLMPGEACPACKTHDQESS